MKCFYHRDLDGECSGAIVKMVYPDCEMFGIQYGDDLPWDSIVEGEQIFMVDFALQPFDDMERLNRTAKLTWIDHHKTALEEAYSRKFLATGGQSIEEAYAGCELVWQYLKDTSLMVPTFVHLLGRYDMWDFTDPDTLPFQFGIRLLDTWPGNQDLWLSLFDKEKIKRIVEDGKTVLKYQKQENTKYCKACAFVTELDGLRCIAANKMLTNSQLFDSVWNPDKYDAMITFGWTNGQWTVSLYSTNSKIDVSIIAKAHGGGGHPKASGFQCDELPFRI